MKYWGYVKPKKCFGFPCSAPPDPLAEIRNILFKIITEIVVLSLKFLLF